MNIFEKYLKKIINTIQDNKRELGLNNLNNFICK